MDSGLSTVEVKVNVPIFSDEPPQRLDQWLYVIETSGGEVNTEIVPGATTPQYRSGMAILSAIVPMVIDIYEIIYANLLYRPARNYNATVFVKADGRTVDHIVFTQR